MVDIQTAHAKLGSQDGNSREHRSRSQMIKVNQLSEIKDVANRIQLWSEPGSRYL